MAQTGFTPLLIYSSSTATNAPTAGNLLNNATGSELAINIADGKLFYKDSANAVQVIAWKVVPATAGGTGQTSYAVGDLLYADTTTTLSKLADVATGNALISGGISTAPSWGKIGLTTHVSGTLPIANGGTNSTSTATAGGISYGTGTAFAFTSVGTSGQALISAGASAPAFGALAIGTANTNVSGALTVTNGGTGLSSLTSTYIPYGNGTSAFSSSNNLIFNGTNLVLGNGGILASAIVSITSVNVPTLGSVRYGSDGIHVQFYNSGGGAAGNISVTGSITAYNATSDYRLKQNISPLQNGLQKILKLKPCSYNFIEGNQYSEGFIAHELQNIIPQAVTGTKDAVDEEGKPIYQGVDASFLIPNITLAIQELNNTINAQAIIISELQNKVGI